MEFTDARPKSSFKAALKRFPYGEASLWISFALCIVAGLSDGNDHAITAAGLFALAAIGVRATRRPKGDPSAMG